MSTLVKRLLAVPALALAALVVVPATPAAAHGETAQEAFLRMGTISFWDVQFSTNQVEQGQEIRLTGTAKVLETWPEQLAEPNEGFIGVVAPGPVVVIKERTINGAPAPHAIHIEKGDVYEFSMTLAGRREGRWHIHPIFGVHGAGSLIGPGQYIEVTKAAGGFTNATTLSDGEEVQLEEVGTGNIAFWAIVWGIVGLAWLLYWIWPKPTVTRLPVTSQIPLNTDGMAYGLITKRDHRAMNVIMLVTIVLLTGGWVYQLAAYPDKMPLQVLRFAPPAAAVDPTFVEARATDATYDPDSHALSVTVTVSNTGTMPATVQGFTTTTLTFPTEGVNPPFEEHKLTVAPDATIQPGSKTTLTLAMTDPVWGDERLMPLNESRMQLTGVLRLKDTLGAENFVTLQTFVRPTSVT